MDNLLAILGINAGALVMAFLVAVFSSERPQGRAVHDAAAYGFAVGPIPEPLSIPLTRRGGPTAWPR
jgi:hypothetical protein